MLGWRFDDLPEELQKTAIRGEQGDIRIRLDDRILPLEWVVGKLLAHLREKLCNSTNTNRAVTPGSLAELEQLVAAIERTEEEQPGATDQPAFDGPQAVVAVPVACLPATRTSLRHACERAGLRVQQMIHSTSAAALLYCQKHAATLAAREQPKRVAIHDFGAGHFSVAVVEIDANGVRELAAQGLRGVGGIDLDQRIAQWMMERFEQQSEIDTHNDPVVVSRMTHAASNAKCALGRDDAEPKVPLNLPFLQADVTGSRHYEDSLTLQRFDELIGDLVTRCMDTTRRALDQAGLSPSDIDTVLLLGGGARVGLLQEQLESLYQQEPELALAVPQTVATGAALVAAADNELELQEGFAHALVVAVDNHPPQVVVAPGQSLPTQVAVELPVPPLTQAPLRGPELTAQTTPEATRSTTTADETPEPRPNIPDADGLATSVTEPLRKAPAPASDKAPAPGSDKAVPQQTAQAQAQEKDVETNNPVAEPPARRSVVIRRRRKKTQAHHLVRRGNGSSSDDPKKTPTDEHDGSTASEQPDNEPGAETDNLQIQKSEDASPQAHHDDLSHPAEGSPAGESPVAPELDPEHTSAEPPDASGISPAVNSDDSEFVEAVAPSEPAALLDAKPEQGAVEQPVDPESRATEGNDSALDPEVVKSVEASEANAAAPESASKATDPGPNSEDSENFSQGPSEADTGVVDTDANPEPDTDVVDTVDADAESDTENLGTVAPNSEADTDVVDTVDAESDTEILDPNSEAGTDVVEAESVPDVLDTVSPKDTDVVETLDAESGTETLEPNSEADTDVVEAESVPDVLETVDPTSGSDADVVETVDADSAPDVLETVDPTSESDTDVVEAVDADVVKTLDADLVPDVDANSEADTDVAETVDANSEVDTDVVHTVDIEPLANADVEAVDLNAPHTEPDVVETLDIETPHTEPDVVETLDTNADVLATVDISDPLAETNAETVDLDAPPTEADVESADINEPRAGAHTDEDDSSATDHSVSEHPSDPENEVEALDAQPDTAPGAGSSLSSPPTGSKNPGEDDAPDPEAAEHVYAEDPGEVQTNDAEASTGDSSKPELDAPESAAHDNEADDSPEASTTPGPGQEPAESPTPGPQREFAEIRIYLREPGPTGECEELLGRVEIEPEALSGAKTFEVALAVDSQHCVRVTVDGGPVQLCDTAELGAAARERKAEQLRRAAKKLQRQQSLDDRKRFLETWVSRAHQVLAQPVSSDELREARETLADTLMSAEGCLRSGRQSLIDGALTEILPVMRRMPAALIAQLAPTGPTSEAQPATEATESSTKPEKSATPEPQATPEPEPEKSQAPRKRKRKGRRRRSG